MCDMLRNKLKEEDIIMEQLQELKYVYDFAKKNNLKIYHEFKPSKIYTPDEFIKAIKEGRFITKLKGGGWHRECSMNFGFCKEKAGDYEW